MAFADNQLYLGLMVEYAIYALETVVSITIAGSPTVPTKPSFEPSCLTQHSTE